MLASFLAFEGPERWLTARLDGAPVGFAFFRPEAHTDGTWNVLAIAVLPEHHNSGIGSQFMQHIEDILRRDRQRVLLVETSGTPVYEATRAFYRARHYTEVGRIPEYWEAGDDKVIFYKHLRARPDFVRRLDQSVPAPRSS